MFTQKDEDDDMQFAETKIIPYIQMTWNIIQTPWKNISSWALFIAWLNHDMYDYLNSAKRLISSHLSIHKKYSIHK